MNTLPPTLGPITESCFFRTTREFLSRHSFIAPACAVVAIAGIATYWHLAANTVQPEAEFVDKARNLIRCYQQLQCIKPSLRGNNLIELEKQIQLWMENHGKQEVLNCEELDLAGQSTNHRLTALPPEVCHFLKLQMLFLKNNQLKDLPPQIGQLTALKRLDLSYNLLETIAPEIGQLTALTLLFLGNNKLVTLPPEIGQLTALEHLELQFNQLRALPQEIEKLTALKTLNIQGNVQATLPQETGQLKKLRNFSLDEQVLDKFVSMSKIPLPVSTEIRELETLQTLNLANNQLEILPQETGQLEGLQNLTLNDNALLQFLSLGNNPLAALFAEIGKIAALTELNPPSNQEMDVSAKITNFIACETLDLAKKQRPIFHNCFFTTPSYIIKFRV